VELNPNNLGIMEDLQRSPRLKIVKVLIYITLGNKIEMEKGAVSRAQKERNQENG